MKSQEGIEVQQERPREVPKKAKSNLSGTCWIRSSNFFRCSSSLASPVYWVMLRLWREKTEKTKQQKNQNDRTRQYMTKMSKPINLSNHENELSNINSWWRFGHSKQKLYTETTSTSTVYTRVCLQSLDVFPAFEALQILHVCCSNAKVTVNHVLSLT
jgi:hypothetical protein